VEIYHKQFLGEDSGTPDPENAAFFILPVPYEGAVSYGAGTADGPDAIIHSSAFLELYDETLKKETCSAGIITLKPLKVSKQSENVTEFVRSGVGEILDTGGFPIVIGGDHSISTGFCRAVQEKYGSVSVIQIDAHADLRESYQGNPYSHASVMARIREITSQTLQIGIRSLSRAEADRIERESLDVCFMDDFRSGEYDLESKIEKIENPVFLTLDVDALDWSVVRSTGTPEPGGFLWDEILTLLDYIFKSKQVVGFDVVELCGNPDDPNSAFAIAKLIYKMIGFNTRRPGRQ
jgi:agmatinase